MGLLRTTCVKTSKKTTASEFRIEEARSVENIIPPVNPSDKKTNAGSLNSKMSCRKKRNPTATAPRAAKTVVKTNCFTFCSYIEFSFIKFIVYIVAVNP